MSTKLNRTSPVHTVRVRLFLLAIRLMNWFVVDWLNAWLLPWNLSIIWIMSFQLWCYHLSFCFLCYAELCYCSLRTTCCFCIVNSASRMTTPDELALKRKTFDDDDGLRRNHAEGAIIYSVPATLFVVRDKFVSTVCSGCLKTVNPQSTSRMQQCSKCKFVRYCSRECQVKIELL